MASTQLKIVLMVVLSVGSAISAEAPHAGVRVAKGIFRLSESQYQLQLNEIKPSPVTELNTVLQTAKIVPSPKSNLNPMVLEGFRIKLIEKNSFLDYLGFKKNDLIEFVGDTKLDNIAAGFLAAQKMRGAKRVEIGIRRNKILKKLVYLVE